MKKLSLLVALGLFTLGTATMVKAGEDEVTLPADDGVEASEVVSEGEQETAVEGFLDENNNGIDDTLEDPSSLEASDSEVPDSEGMKENLKEGLKQTDDSTTDADGDGVTADKDIDDSDPEKGAAE